MESKMTRNEILKAGLRCTAVMLAFGLFAMLMGAISAGILVL
jgi:hypothetical protein